MELDTPELMEHVIEGLKDQGWKEKWGGDMLRVMEKGDKEIKIYTLSNGYQMTVVRYHQKEDDSMSELSEEAQELISEGLVTEKGAKQLGESSLKVVHMIFFGPSQEN